MQFANVDGKKSCPSPKLKGSCLHCGSEMVSKCGRLKVWHWAHKGRDRCDAWWENETEWHRNWKNHFPVDWQKSLHINKESGERHIADVQTPHGLTIEFQHSSMKMEERESREEFYGNMIWIVNGLRGDLDEAYFNMGLHGPIERNPLTYSIEWYGKGKILQVWQQQSARVYLDFGKNTLWRLVHFDSLKRRGIVGPISKSVLIEDCINGEPIHVSKLDSHETRYNFPRPLQKYSRS